MESQQKRSKKTDINQVMEEVRSPKGRRSDVLCFFSRYMDDGGAGRTNTLGFLSEYLAGGRSLIGKQVLIKFFADETDCFACGKCCMDQVQAKGIYDLSSEEVLLR